MSRKPSEQRHRRYVQEYVNETFPDRDFVIYNCALGPPPEALTRAHPEIPLSHFQKWRFYADAVVGWRELLILIEVKLREASEGIGKLLQYQPLVKQTAELAPYAGRPLQLRLVVPRPDPRVLQVAATHDIILAIFYKPWVGEYLRELGLM